MDTVLCISGWLLVFLVLYDVLHTTIHVKGAGILTRRLNLMLWRIFPRKHGLQLAGPTLVMATFLQWFFLFWLGWCFIFLSGDPSVVSDPDGSPASLSGLVYFVGFSIITLGVGDYTPDGALWQMLTVFASASGFFLVTLVITYLLPLVSAVVEQRQLAAYIHSLSETPEGTLESAWNGEDFTNLEDHLSNLTPSLHRQTYLHLAYPILHYFCSEHRRSAIAPAIASLDETVTLLLHAVPVEQRPTRGQLQPLRCALNQLLETLEAAYISPAAEPEPLIWKGQQVIDLPDEVSKRRRLLAGWMKDQGWAWGGSSESCSTRLRE